MSEAIIVAIITGAFTLFGVMLSNQKKEGVIEQKLNYLSEIVKKHNSVVERTYKVESDLNTIFVEISEIKEDIKDLKNNRGV